MLRSTFNCSVCRLAPISCACSGVTCGGAASAIADLGDLTEGRTVRVASWCISAQRPPTAKGMGFMVIEDENGRLPVALPPRLAREMHRVLRDARIVIVAGRLERSRWYRSVLATDLRAME